MNLDDIKPVLAAFSDRLRPKPAQKELKQRGHSHKSAAISRAQRARSRQSFYIPLTVCPVSYKSRPRAAEIKRLLNEHKISQAHMGDMIGVSQSSMSGFIRPTRESDCPEWLLEAVRKVLKVEG